MFNPYREENSTVVDENLVSYLTARVCNGIDDLAETIMNPANCRSSTVILSTKLYTAWIRIRLHEYYETTFG